MQPIERFDLDAAIIFSDILMVPYGLGQGVDFKKGKGPILTKMNLNKFLNYDEKIFIENLQPVYKAIKKTRKKLNKKKSLISFIGSPWTLIVYMLGLKKEKNIIDTNIIKKKKSEINLILSKINNFLCLHVHNQIKAGADVVQIFDSWAGLIPEENLENYCYRPNAQLVNFCKKINAPVICFPKGIKKNYKPFNEFVKPDGINIDYDVDPEWARKNLDGVCVQGGMDPKTLFLKDEIMFQKTDRYLKIFKDYPYIFNLGHGLLPETNPDKVKRLINYIKSKK
jgi:uroporphyrinogen decarboxylase